MIVHDKMIKTYMVLCPACDSRPKYRLVSGHGDSVTIIHCCGTEGGHFDPETAARNWNLAVSRYDGIPKQEYGNNFTEPDVKSEAAQGLPAEDMLFIYDDGVPENKESDFSYKGLERLVDLIKDHQRNAPVRGMVFWLEESDEFSMEQLKVLRDMAKNSPHCKIITLGDTPDE